MLLSTFFLVWKDEWGKGGSSAHKSTWILLTYAFLDTSFICIMFLLLVHHHFFGQSHSTSYYCMLSQVPICLKDLCNSVVSSCFTPSTFRFKAHILLLETASEDRFFFYSAFPRPKAYVYKGREGGGKGETEGWKRLQKQRVFFIFEYFKALLKHKLENKNRPCQNSAVQLKYKIILFTGEWRNQMWKVIKAHLLTEKYAHMTKMCVLRDTHLHAFKGHLTAAEKKSTFQARPGQLWNVVSVAASQLWLKPKALH